MISARIDLTDNRDFSGGLIHEIIKLDTPTSSLEFARWKSLSNIMSNEEYRKLLRMEAMFGMRTHYNESINVFNKDNELINTIHEHCERCGKYILPWNRHRGLCESCDGIVSNSRIPWKPNYKAFIRDDSRDILRMK